MDNAILAQKRQFYNGRENEMLRKILKQKKITAKQLSEETGIHCSTIQKYSSGQRMPTVDNAKKIAKVLKIDWWLLF